MRVARKSADEAARLSPGEPRLCCSRRSLRKLAGDRGAAEHAFRAMSTRADTKLLGLRGLLYRGAAPQRYDRRAPRRAGAVREQPSLAWAGQAVLDDHCAANDWAGALLALEQMKSGLDKADYRRKRAVLLTARALALNDIERDTSLANALEAVKLAPDLVPAAALAAGGSPKPVKRARPGKFSPRRGRSIRIPISRTPTPTCALAIPHGPADADADACRRNCPRQREGALAVGARRARAQEFGVARRRSRLICRRRRSGSRH